MATTGGQANNNGAHKGKLWNDALRKAIVQDDGKRVNAAAEKLLDLAAEGTPWAVKELADRLDGKSLQGIELSGDADKPLVIQTIVRTIVDPNNTDTTSI